VNNTKGRGNSALNDVHAFVTSSKGRQHVDESPVYNLLKALSAQFGMGANGSRRLTPQECQLAYGIIEAAKDLIDVTKMEEVNEEEVEVYIDDESFLNLANKVYPGWAEKDENNIVEFHPYKVERDGGEGH